VADRPSDLVFVVSANHGNTQSTRWPSPAIASARTGDREVRLVVPSRGRLTGRLVDEAGAAIDNATVGLGLHSATTRHDGAFEIRDVTPGRYQVMVRVGDIASRVNVAEIRSGEITDLGTVSLLRRHSRALAGRIVDAAGAPVGDVCVELGVIRPPPVDEDDPPGGFHAYRTVYTTPDGLFRIPDIPPTPMLARATDPAYRDSTSIAIPTLAVSPGDPPAITLVVSPRDAR
jgi:hypothetical protein